MPFGDRRRVPLGQPAKDGGRGGGNDLVAQCPAAHLKDDLGDSRGVSGPCIEVVTHQPSTAPSEGTRTRVKYWVVGATCTWKVPVATSPLLSRTWQVTVLEKRGKVDPEAGVQVPGVAPGIAGGVDHVATGAGLARRRHALVRGNEEGAGEVGAGQRRVHRDAEWLNDGCHHSAGQCGARQVGIGEVCSTEVAVAHVRPSEIGAAEVGAAVPRGKVSPLEIGPDLDWQIRSPTHRG